MTLPTLPLIVIVLWRVRKKVVVEKRVGMPVGIPPEQGCAQTLWGEIQGQQPPCYNDESNKMIQLN